MKTIVKEVLETPTAPLHEHRIMELVVSKALAWGYRVKKSPKGNLLVGTAAAFRKPNCIITAHMDHPGIRLLSVQGTQGEVGILGGVPLDQLIGSRWQLWSWNGITTGVVGRKLRKKWMGKNVYAIRLKNPIPIGAFGQLDVPSPVWRGNVVSNRAMDNVINVGTLLALLESHRRKKTARFLAFFTRAEEIGMVGASEAIHSHFLPRSAPIIVLEASSAQVAKVTPGAGPVLRVGDRCSSFNPDVDLWLQQAAKGLKIQRALMAGGTCEATVYNVYGYCVGSIALPLVNYHNRGTSRLSAEQIDWRDFQELQKWLSVAIKTPFDPERIHKEIQKKFYAEYRKWPL